MFDKLSVKRALGTLWRPLAGGDDRRIVLLYHSVGGGPHATPVEAFQRQMEFLAATGCLLPMDEFMEGATHRPLTATVSFDDGYASVAKAALPILSGLHASATVFLNTAMVSVHRPNVSDPPHGYYPEEESLTWREVERLADRGWRIGSHGVEHLDLTAASDEVAREQLVGSKREIERMLGATCDHFAYTWGRHSRRLRELVAAAGYRFAFSAEHGPVGQHPEPTAVPRINIANEYGIDDFRAIVRGDWDYLGWVQKRRNQR